MSDVTNGQMSAPWVPDEPLTASTWSGAVGDVGDVGDVVLVVMLGPPALSAFLVEARESFHGSFHRFHGSFHDFHGSFY